MKFRTVVMLGGKTATGMEVPEEVVEALDSGKRPRVRATINGYTYRSSVARMGSRYMLPLSADNRTKAGASAGDEVDVELEVDNDPREVEVPSDLAEALAGSPAAKKFFDGLSFSKQSWYVLRVENAKKAETRQRRVTESVTMLEEGRLP